MRLPRENHTGVELNAAQKVNLRSSEEAGKLRGWIVILSADSERRVGITDTSLPASMQMPLSRNADAAVPAMCARLLRGLGGSFGCGQPTGLPLV